MSSKKKIPDEKHQKNRIKSFVIWAMIFLVAGIFCYLQNNLLTVSYYVFQSEKVDYGLEGFRIVQISDLHNKEFGKDGEVLAKKVASLSPDIIVLTGDLVDGSHTNIDIAVSFAEKAVNIAPTYYITGNHEVWMKEEKQTELFEGLKEAGVILLDDEAIRIEKNGSSFCLVGLDDVSLRGIALQSMELKEDTLNVLLAHEPQLIERYAAQPVDLVLSGHAHGGQFRFPVFGGVYAPGQGFHPKYTCGMYEEADTVMVVSRGLGNSVIPLRLFNYPDIVCVTFETK